MSRRYFVVCTDSPAASGGRAVLYDTVALLRESGRDAYVLHMLPNAQYSLSPHKFETAYFSWRLRAGNYVDRSRRVRFRAELERLFVTLKSARNIPYEPCPDDIIITPDHLTHAVQWAFPDLARIVFSQNSFGYLRSHKLGQLYNGAPLEGVVGNLAISDTCIGAMELVGATQIDRVPVCPNLEIFDPKQKKQRKICYMPRKRRFEADLIDQALRARGNIGDYELVCIDGMNQKEVAQHLAEDRFFISLMRNEALGFPAMEAMASGCIVIGYTGLGTEEYFDSDSGVPVSEGNTVGLVKAVEHAVADYDANPDPWDRMRQLANDRVRRRYNPEVFRSSLLSAIGGIERRLDS